MQTLVEMRPKSLHVTGMFLACNMQGFGMFAMHVCMLCHAGILNVFNACCM